MQQSVYYYQNKQDLLEFFDFLKANNIDLYTYLGEPFDIAQLEEVNEFTFRPKLLYIADKSTQIVPSNFSWFEFGKTELIEISMQYDEGNFYQPSSAVLVYYGDNVYLKDCFKKIKKYVRTNYTISNDKLYYVAPHVAKDWYERKIEFPGFVKCREIRATSDWFSLSDFCDHVQKSGYSVIPQHKKTDEPDSLDTSRGFIIFRDDMKLRSYVSDKKRFRCFLNSSECIFVWARKRKKLTEYRFILDDRLDNEGHPDVRELFELIQEYIDGKIPD